MANSVGKTSRPARRTLAGLRMRQKSRGSDSQRRTTLHASAAQPLPRLVAVDYLHNNSNLLGNRRSRKPRPRPQPQKSSPCAPIVAARQTAAIAGTLRWMTAARELSACPKTALFAIMTYYSRTENGSSFFAWNGSRWGEAFRHPISSPDGRMPVCCSFSGRERGE